MSMSVPLAPTGMATGSLAVGGPATVDQLVLQLYFPAPPKTDLRNFGHGHPRPVPSCQCCELCMNTLTLIK